jgi:hypothetical protein
MTVSVSMIETDIVGRSIPLMLRDIGGEGAIEEVVVKSIGRRWGRVPFMIPRDSTQNDRE